LGKRSRHLLARGKQANQVGVAVARELVGCIWVIAKQVKVIPESIMMDSTPPWNR